MGCASSSDTKGDADAAAAKAKPIPVQRQQEAKQHFGLSTHTVIKPLGTGGSGETYLCKRNDTKDLEAVKVIKRPIPNILREMMVNEILIQSQLGEGHFNIVNAHEVLLSSSHLCLMLEFAAGGTLTDYVSSRYSTVDQRGGLFLDEHEARYLFQQCIEAVDYCHRNNVAHRDLKLDNTLLDGSSPPFIKICDFGFAKLMGTDNLNTKIGTPVYMAPALIKKGQQGYSGRASDVWACGVLLYVMLLGAFPFEHSNNAGGDEQRAFNEVHYEQIRIHWTENERNKGIVAAMSTDARDLLDHIFMIDESKRIKIEDIRKHPWFTEPLVSPYKESMAKLIERQALIDEQTKLVRTSNRGVKDDTIREIVASACAPLNSEENPLQGKEIMLKRNLQSAKLSVLNETTPHVEPSSSAGVQVLGANGQPL